MPRLTVPEHPCFSAEAHKKFGRIHLPVAPACNLQCAYCDRRCDCPNESRPGVASAVLTPCEASARTAAAIDREPRLRVAGIAGPGEPLANPETFETLHLLRTRFPEMTLCVSTNGLLLPNVLDELIDCGIRTLTITINAVTVQTAGRLYTQIRYGKKELGAAGVPFLLERQRAGLYAAVDRGLAVKVNTVLVPGVNEAEIESVAALAADAGASLMNITPLIPCGQLSCADSPSAAQLAEARRIAGRFLPQFYHCRQCRADACGVPGLE